MSWSPTKITCKCGAVIETRWTSELKDAAVQIKEHFGVEDGMAE